MPLQQFIFILIITVISPVSLYVLAQKPRDIVHRTFFLFVAGVIMWIAGFVLFSSTELFIFARLILLGGITLVVGLCLFSQVFPSGKPARGNFFTVTLPFVAITGILLSSRIVLKGAVVHAGGYLQPVNGPLFPLYAAALTYYVFVSLNNFRKHYRGSRGKARMQMKYLCLGLGVFIGCALIFDALLPALGITGANTLGPLSSIVFIGFTAYAIVRHQLLDIRIVIQRGLIYSVLLALIVALYFVLIGIFGYLLEETTPVTAVIAALFTSIIGVFGTPAIDRRLKRITDRLFFKDTYDYSEALYTLSKILNANVDFEIIKEKTSSALKDILRASSVAIDFNPHAIEVYHEGGGDSMVIPIEYEGAIKGSIVVGAKRSGDPFTDQDRALVKTFSEQASVALEKARLFKEVEDYSLELEDKVRERTAEIRKLQKDQEHMIMDISHGLQNPLVLARLEVDTMKKNVPGNKTLDVLEHAIDNISGFIYKLMHLTKLEHANGNGHSDTVSLSELVEELVEYFEVLAREKDIALTHKIEPGISLSGEKERLEEMITNIVSNAVKYNVRDIESKRVHIELRREGDTVVLTVEDTGVGIEPGELPHIFDRFYQTKEKRLDGIESHGLGLSIAKKIAELHGGSIAVLSTPGENTRVVVSFRGKP